MLNIELRGQPRSKGFYAKTYYFSEFTSKFKIQCWTFDIYETSRNCRLLNIPSLQ